MRLAAAVLASVLGLAVPATRAAAQAGTSKKPTLVVLVTIDQFRADYLDRFGPQMTGGIARMMRTTTTPSRRPPRGTPPSCRDAFRGLRGS